MMAENSTNVDKKNNRSFIDGPAGIHDEFDICAVDPQVYFIKQGAKVKSDEETIKTTNSIRRSVRSVLSTKLMQGMSIKAIPSKEEKTQVNEGR